MPSIRHYAGSALLIGTLLVGGVACSSSGGSNSQKSFCATLKTFQDESTNNKATPKEQQDELKRMAASLKSTAPSELKDDVALLSDYLNKVADVDLTDPKAATAAAASFDEKKVTAASDNIAKYAKDNCKIDLNK